MTHDEAMKKAEGLLPCAHRYPWCEDEDGNATGEHYLGDTCPTRYAELFAAALLEAHESGRRKGLEEAANVAEDTDTVDAKGDTRYAQLGDASATRRAIVGAIRALITEGQEDKQ
jgi:hypothetical protein